MISHTLVSIRGDKPSPYGGVVIAYRCNCGAEFSSAHPEPRCPVYLRGIEVRHGG